MDGTKQMDAWLEGFAEKAAERGIPAEQIPHLVKAASRMVMSDNPEFQAGYNEVMEKAAQMPSWTDVVPGFVRSMASGLASPEAKMYRANQYNKGGFLKKLLLSQLPGTQGALNYGRGGEYTGKELIKQPQYFNKYVAPAMESQEKYIRENMKYFPHLQRGGGRGGYGGYGGGGYGGGYGSWMPRYYGGGYPFGLY